MSALMKMAALSRGGAGSIPGGAGGTSNELFNTTIYRGTGTAQVVSTGIDLVATPQQSLTGGLVILKNRDDAQYFGFYDTMRGPSRALSTNWPNEETYLANTEVTAFTPSGFNLAASSYNISTNVLDNEYVAWTFKRAPKFFDIVTWTGDGNADRILPHALGISPGMVAARAVSQAGEWYVGHMHQPSAGYFALNTSAAFITTGFPTPVDFDQNNIYVHQGTAPRLLNQAGVAYIAYVFAHDPDDANGIIKCGSFTTDSTSKATVDIGWEPQFFLFKSAAAGSWYVTDDIRGIPDVQVPSLILNNYASETKLALPYPYARGMVAQGLAANTTYYYLAIRRPNKVPTLGTEIFKPSLFQAGQGAVLNVGFAADLVMNRSRSNGTAYTPLIADRKRGFGTITASPSTGQPILQGASTAIETTGLYEIAYNFSNTGYRTGSNPGGTGAAISYAFKRAPKVFDVVTHIGTGTTDVEVPHALGVEPEMVITKSRNTTGSWTVFHAALGRGKNLAWDSAAAAVDDANLWGTAWSNIGFRVGNDARVNAVAKKYVSYLFASLPGISKVGSYVGNGSSLDINCGFSNGSRFVMVKRANGAGDWVVVDSARGITVGSYAQEVFSTPGSFFWTCPAGVTNISVVGVSAGAHGQAGMYGGGGGALVYKNNIPVTPGVQYLVIVPSANLGTTDYTGSLVAFASDSGSTIHLAAYSANGPNPGTAVVGTGFSGGYGNIGAYSGGGGAGGYTGVGGNGGYGYSVRPTAGQGGGGAGGGSSFPNNRGGGGGGGTGVYGLGASGAISANPGPWGDNYGAAGGGGGGGSGGANGTAASSFSGGNGGFPGGGGASGAYNETAGTYSPGGNGAGGMLRIVMNAPPDYFPNAVAYNGNDPFFAWNGQSAELANIDSVDPLSVGFRVKQNLTTNLNLAGETYVYLALS